MSARGRLESEGELTSLRVYLIRGCAGHDNALKILERIGDSGLYDINIEIVDLGEQHETPPEDMFAVPAWYIDGDLFQLGNPTVSQILRKLRSAKNNASDE